MKRTFKYKLLLRERELSLGLIATAIALTVGLAADRRILAAEDGYYALFALGGSYGNGVNIRNRHMDLRIESPYAYAFEVGIGYRAHPRFRFESTLTYASALIDDVESRIDKGVSAYPGVTKSGRGKRPHSRGDLTSIATFISGYYDIGPDDFLIRPSIGAGFGLSRLNFDIAADKIPIVDDEDWVPVAKVSAGFSHNLTAFSAIGIQYDYAFAISTPDLTDRLGERFEADHRAHHVRLGTRLSF